MKPRVWMHSVLCFALAAVFDENTPTLWFGLLAYAAFCMNWYRTLVWFPRRRGRRAQLAIPPETDLINPKT